MTAVELNYREEGRAEGPALLLGGSLGTRLAMWDPQVQALAETFRIIRFDQRGHGGSPAPEGPYSIDELGEDVIALMDRLGIERADYCGLSIGGMVGQWLAINAPQRIGRLVLISTAPNTLNADTFHERARTVRAARSTEGVADAAVANWFTERWRDAHPELVQRHRQMIVDTPVQGYAGCCEAVATHDVRAGLSGVTAPTLVLHGAQDGAIPPSQGEKIAAAISGARFELLDPASHLASVERASEVNELIAEHLHV